MQVYYSVISGGPDGKLSTRADNVSIEAAESHLVEAIVNSVPPERCISAKEWNLIHDTGLLRLWIKVDCFRFLGFGDWEHHKRPANIISYNYLIILVITGLA
jgi:hypothetical protein